MVSFRGKKGWAMPRLVSFNGLIQNFQWASPPLSYGGSSPKGMHAPLICQGERRTEQGSSIIYYVENTFSSITLSSMENEKAWITSAPARRNSRWSWRTEQKKYINIADSHNANTTKDKLVTNCQTIGNLPYNPNLFLIKNCITKKVGKQ